MGFEKVLKSILGALLSIAFYVFMIAILNKFNLGVEFESFIHIIKVFLIPLCIFVGYFIVTILFS